MNLNYIKYVRFSCGYLFCIYMYMHEHICAYVGIESIIKCVTSSTMDMFIFSVRYLLCIYVGV